ncbi:hypothetical protein CIK05_05995 [Bdellovibrio sp. qaytius]|nr:hypothetical protein CIK05_05995 [Bdellovibrio sp. qaytius]
MKFLVNKSNTTLSATLIDSDVKNRLENRDPEFLKLLFSEVNPYLIRVCGANGYFKEHADEVIHDTWAVFFQNITKFEGRSNIRTFVCGILFNKIREYRRSQSKLVFDDDSEQSFNKSFSKDGWWNTEPEDPHKFTALKQAADFVKECMEGLTEQQKTAFVMREVDEENSEDICNVLGVNITHLRVLIYRAKDKLRQCLDGKISSGEF